MTTITSEDIAKANDSFRSAFNQDYIHRIILTTSVAHSKHMDLIICAVRVFDDWETKVNDPYGEHDMAKFEVDGVDYIFKIDYLDPESKEGFGKDPRDGEVVRVLTIMAASDY